MYSLEVIVVEWEINHYRSWQSLRYAVLVLFSCSWGYRQVVIQWPQWSFGVTVTVTGRYCKRRPMRCHHF
jgi:hypothetical protein